jgi:hypothetical protein
VGDACGGVVSALEGGYGYWAVFDCGGEAVGTVTSQMGCWIVVNGFASPGACSSCTAALERVW